jgi:PAS domain S-box-containing protein
MPWVRRYGQMFRVYVLPFPLTFVAAALSPWISKPGTPPLFLFFFLAVLTSAYFGKRRSGVIAAVLSTMIAAWALAAPVHSFAVASIDDRLRFLAFLISSAVGIHIIHRLQEALYREQLLRTLVESSPTLTLLAESDGRIRMFNSHCEAVTGYRRDEVLGKTISELFLPAEWQGVVRERFESVDTLADPHENPWRTKSGELRMIEWTCRRIERGLEPDLILGIGRDVTEHKRRQKLEREIDRLEAKTELANELAHELNNPLQALTNMFMLLTSSDGDGHGRAYSHLVGEQLGRVTELSRRLLRATSESGTEAAVADSRSQE